MSEINTGGPAFPFNAADHGFEPSAGMNLRDWFAGQALVAMGTWMPPNPETMKQRALLAYQQADALLAAREVAK